MYTKFVYSKLMCAKFFFFYPVFTTLYEFQPPHSGVSEITHKDAPVRTPPLDE